MFCSSDFSINRIRHAFLIAILFVAAFGFLTSDSHADTHGAIPPSSEPPEFTRTVLETGPTVQTLKSQRNVPEAASVIAPAAAQPIGALTGRIVYTHGGHGWTYNNANGSGWYTQREVTEEMNEDYGNMDQMTMFAFYCFNAGATVVPLRPIGHQTNEVVLDNDSANVSYAGLWSNSGGTIFYGQVGDVPYRFAAVDSNETATATYTPNIPVTGFYPVYTWVAHGGNRTSQLYKINHTGGQSMVRIPHNMVGNGWVYLGSYYFNAGLNADTGAVVISNLEPAPSSAEVVIADAIRFGNGMGDVVPTAGGSETPTKSNYPREEECSRYWVQRSLGQGQSSTIYNSSTSDGNDNVSTPPRMAREMNNSAVGNMFKRVFISFHSNACGCSPATARGAMGLYNDPVRFPGANTPNQQSLALFIASEVDSDMKTLPLEVPWKSTALTYSQTFAFGEINNSVITDEFDATIIEVAFHDNVSDAKLMRDPKVRNWMARASYQGALKYFNNYDAAPLTFLPEPPTNVRAVATTKPGEMRVSWSAPMANGGSGHPTNFIVFRSTNGYGFGNPISAGFTATIVVSNLAPDTEYYFRVAAANAGGESLPSETVGCRQSSTNDTKILFVNGFTRFDRTTNLRQTPTALNWDPPDNTGTMDRVIPRSVNSFDYVVQHGGAIAASGRGFDSCHRDAIANGLIVLTNYQIVIWQAGQELTNIFNSTLQSRLTTFLADGGHLFLSGSEIAGNLDRASGPTLADRTFFNNQLHANLASDAHTNSGSYTFTSAANSIFAGNPGGTFDNGNNGIYWVKSPSVLTPFGTGAQIALNYSGGLGGAAAIQYDGSAGGGKVVYFAFPFETILSVNVRNAAMEDLLNFFVPPKDLRFESIALVPSGVQLSLSSDKNNIVSVERSTNLVNWTEITNFANTNGTFQFIDGSSNDWQQFYRAKRVE